MWICKQCNLELSDEFNTCWNCWRLKAEVKADAPTDTANLIKIPGRPQTVTIAVALLCLELTLNVGAGIITTLAAIVADLNANPNQPASQGEFLYFIVFSVVAVMGLLGIIQGFIAYKIYHRKNWARIVYCILAALSAVVQTRIIMVQYQTDGLYALGNFGFLVLQIVIVGLLNERRAKEWFN